MVYYRIATQKQQSTAWEWHSTIVKSLEAVFQLGQQYISMSAEHTRIFAASTAAYLDALLARVNLGLSSNSLTLTQLLHDHQSITTAYVRRFEVELGWQKDEGPSRSMLDLKPAMIEEPHQATIGTLGRAVDVDFALDQESWGTNHQAVSYFARSEFSSQVLAWIMLHNRMQASNLIS